MSSREANHHESTAGRFGAIIEEVRDWEAPTPVPEWHAHQVVEHLLEWFPGFLQAMTGIPLEDDADDDLPTRWRRRTADVQAILESEASDQPLSEGPFAGQTLAQTVDRIYTADIFMHSWDLARSAGVDPRLDPEVAGAMVAGMREMEESLRSSGHFGPAHPTTSTDTVDQLMAFVGRDPEWRP